MELEAVWQDVDDAVATLMATPFGPSMNALAPGTQEQVRTLLAERLGPSLDGTVTIKTTSHIGRGIK